MNVGRDHRGFRLEQRDFSAEDGAVWSSLRAINKTDHAAWVVVRGRDGSLDPWFVSEGNCKTIVSATPSAQFDKIEVLVSPSRDEPLMPWPVWSAQS